MTAANKSSRIDGVPARLFEYEFTNSNGDTQHNVDAIVIKGKTAYALGINSVRFSVEEDHGLFDPFLATFALK